MEAAILLKQFNLRNTNVRSEVLETFISSEGTALSHSQLEEKLVDSDRVTLYRTLKTFENCGLIHQAIDGSGVMKFALCGSHCSEDHHSHNHAHFRCEKCSNTYCLDEEMESKIKLPPGYTVSGMHIAVTGVCDRCKK